MRERVIASRAEHQVSRTARNVSELRRDLADCCSVDRKQRRCPARRKKSSQLCCDIRPAADVSGVVENGIAEENDVGHRTKMRNCAPRPKRSPLTTPESLIDHGDS